MATSGLQRFNGRMHMQCRSGLAADGLEKAAHAVEGSIPSRLMDRVMISYLVSQLIRISMDAELRREIVRI